MLSARVYFELGLARKNATANAVSREFEGKVIWMSDGFVGLVCSIPNARPGTANVKHKSVDLSNLKKIVVTEVRPEGRWGFRVYAEYTKKSGEVIPSSCGAEDQFIHLRDVKGGEIGTIDLGYFKSIEFLAEEKSGSTPAPEALSEAKARLVELLVDENARQSFEHIDSAVFEGSVLTIDWSFAGASNYGEGKTLIDLAKTDRVGILEYPTVLKLMLRGDKGALRRIAHGNDDIAAGDEWHIVMDLDTQYYRNNREEINRLLKRISSSF